MQRMKFGKIQKFSVALKIWLRLWEFWPLRTSKGWNLTKSGKTLVCLKIWLKNEIFDHFGPAKDEIWQNSEIFSRVENLAQIMRVLKTPNQQRMKFDKIQKNFDLCWTFGSKMRFLTTPNQQRMKFGKIQKNFSRAENLAQNLRVLNTQDMQRMKFGKIQKFSVALKIWLRLWEFWTLRTSKGWNLTKSWKTLVCLKIWLKNEIFDHFGPAKDEIWQNPEIFSRVENLAQIMRVLTTPNQQRMKFDKIWKNFDLCWKFGSKMRFWPLRTCEGWKLAKFRNF